MPEPSPANISLGGVVWRCRMTSTEHSSGKLTDFGQARPEPGLARLL
jgi:hypothetical protein